MARTNTSRLVVSECYGRTWQGEGPSVGRLTAILRLGRCNLACQFCDSKFTWDWERFDPEVELHEFSPEELLAQLDAIGAPMVMVTGGEPLLQQRLLEPVLEGIKSRSWRVEVETAGTIAPTLRAGLVDQFNVSPKLANSGNELHKRYRPDVLRAFEATGSAIFKFVVVERGDLDEVQAIVDECALTDVWIMPEGTDPATLRERMQLIADDVLERGWNLTTRLHVLIWGAQRGV